MSDKIISPLDLLADGSRLPGSGIEPTDFVYAELADLPSFAAKLFAAAGSRSLFLTRPWFENFVRHVVAHESKCQYWYVVPPNASGEDTGAVLPMWSPHRRPALFAPNCIESMGNYYSSLFGIVHNLPPDAILRCAERFVGAITVSRPRWDLVDLAPLQQDGCDLTALRSAFTSAGWRTQDYFRFGNWYLPADGLRFDEYWSTRNSKLRNTVRRKRKRFEATVGARIEIIQGGARLEAGIDAFQRVYAHSWKRAEPYPNFIPGLIRTCAHEKWLRLGVAWIGEKPIAAQLWIVCGGIAAIYKLAYDNEFKAYSAGALLSVELMEHVIDIDGVREVDYLTGDDPYKRDWMTHRRERWGLLAINSRTVWGRALIVRHLYAPKIKPVIKASMRPLIAVRRGVATLGGERAGKGQGAVSGALNPGPASYRFSWDLQPALSLCNQHAADWQRIVRDTYHAHPMLDLKFVGPLVEHFADEEVRLARCTIGRRVVAMALLRPGRAGTWETFLPSHAEIAPVIHSAEFVSNAIDIWAGIFPVLPGVAWRLLFYKQDPKFPGATLDSKKCCTESSPYGTTLGIDLSGSFSEFWAERDRRLRKNTERGFRRLGHGGHDAVVAKFVRVDEMAAAVAAHGRLESGGWKGKAGTAIDADNEQGRYYIDVLQAFARSGGARVFQLRVADRVVASQLAILQGGILVLLKIAYDQEFSRVGPGRLILYSVIEDAFQATDIRSVEFYTNAAKEDMKWASEWRNISHVTLYRNAAWRLGIRGARRLRRRNIPDDADA